MKPQKFSEHFSLKPTNEGKLLANVHKFRKYENFFKLLKYRMSNALLNVANINALAFIQHNELCCFRVYQIC